MKFKYRNIRQNIQPSCLISLMDRYIFQQLGWFFLFSVCCLTALGIAVGTVAELAYKISEFQLPIRIAIFIFCYKIPEYAAYALPISLLLTGLMVYGRLNSDRELTALFSFGISIYRVILPALLFSLIVTGITFLLNELIVPAANYQANLLQNPYITKTELNLQHRNIYYAEYASGLNATKKVQRIYFAEQYNQPRLINVTILSFSQEYLEQMITAQSAQWNQQQQTWNLVQGAIAHFDHNAKINNREKFTAKQLSFPKTFFQIVNQGRSTEDMNIHQAKEYLNLIEDSEEPTKIAQFAVRIQQKYAFPFICVVFASIGSVIGIKYFELNRARSFALCVGIVFAYYCLGFALGSLGITGVIPPWLAAWLPNFIGFGVGGYLLLMAKK
jgi:lipopolysaccharide export system permease protein